MPHTHWHYKSYNSVANYIHRCLTYIVRVLRAHDSYNPDTDKRTTGTAQVLNAAGTYLEQLLRGEKTNKKTNDRPNTAFLQSFCEGEEALLYHSVSFVIWCTFREDVTASYRKPHTIRVSKYAN